MNMIIGKRQIILATLVVALSVAVYINYKFTASGEKYIATDAVMEEEENYGDAQFVDGKVVVPESENYFAQARLTRSKSRDEAVAAMKSMIEDTSLEAGKKAELTEEAAKMAMAIETEGKIENMIRAKGFSDCMVYCESDKVDVMVQTSGLLDNEVIQIRDVVLSETGVPVENISIVEVK